MLAAHGDLISLTSNLTTFIATVDFTQGGSETLTINVPAGANDKRFYNKPAPLVKYTSGGNHLPGRWNPPGLFASGNIIYTPESTSIFGVTNTQTDTNGYRYSDAEASGFYDIQYSTDSAASVLSSNAETYDMSNGDTLTMKVDNGSNQTATFNATAGYTESTIAVTDKFLIVAGVMIK